MSLQLVLVTDTNIWIDLRNGGLYSEIFRLPCQFVTPDFAKTEFTRFPWDELEERGLNFFELGPSLIQEIIDLRPAYSRLSIVDLSAFVLAKDLEAILITGDRGLRELAKRNNIEVHGVLWIIDNLVCNQIIKGAFACDCLNLIIEKGARLPKDECEKYLDSWNSGSNK